MICRIQRAAGTPAFPPDGARPWYGGPARRSGIARPVRSPNESGRSCVMSTGVESESEPLWTDPTSDPSHRARELVRREAPRGIVALALSTLSRSFGTIMLSRILLSIAAGGMLLCGPLAAQVTAPDSTLWSAFRWRSVGPANMAGRITDVEGIPSPSKTFFVAAAAGGIWKTTNAGTTFRSMFDSERVISMGDLAIAPSDTMIVWAGTGEEDSRNSISPGGGIYKSTDGGLTWEHKGLTATQVIGRIVIHPSNPDIVYVAALGHIWGPNTERGLYKTTDGGETWQLIKFISDKAGFVDMVMHPENADVLFAASWERVRGPYFLKSGGPGSALWKTVDAGKTWTEVKGGGFPETMKGRIGVAIATSNPDIMYAIVEADTGKGHTSRPSGLYRSADGGATWEKTADDNVRPFYYSQVRVDPSNPDRVYWSSTPVKFSDEGGKNARNATVGVHVDHHAMWIDPTDPEHFVVGNDGGIAQTWDRGGNYDVLNIVPLGQFYEVSYNMEIPYRVCGGLQDNGSWCGPSRRRQGSITNHMWFSMNGGDGFFTQQDPEDPNIVFAESQGGNMARINLATGERSSLQKPDWRQRYTTYEDSILIDWPDTTVQPRGAVQRRIDDIRRRQRADSVALDLRWNWNTPFFLSRHNSRTFYAGANRVLKSTKRGDDLYPISPDLTTNDAERIRVSTTTTGGITPDVTGAETHSTIVALAESPLKPGILYVGTDDGNVWLTKNDGGAWENLTGRFPRLPPKTWVARIEPSHHDSMRFYVAFDRHREDDFTPYLYVTNDFGKTFRSIANDLPTGAPDFLHVIREDPYNQNLLFVGTDLGVYASLDRGRSWHRFMEGLPAVPVHDLQIHPRDRELIAATHGRSIWIVGIAALEQLNDSVLALNAFLFEPKTAYQYSDPRVGGESTGHKWFEASSPQYGAEIVYRMASGDRRSRPQIVITDVQGDTVQTIQGTGGPGIHRVTWNFQRQRPPSPPLSPAGRRDSIIAVRKLDVVFDSLKAEGMNERMLDRVKERMVSGNTQELFRAFGGAGGGQAARGFQERPGESQPRGGAGRRPAGPPESAQEAEEGPGGPGAGMGAGMMPDRDTMREIFTAVRRAMGRGFGFGGRGGGGGAPAVNTGDYRVSITVDGETLSRVLRVERVGLGTEEDEFPLEWFEW